MISWDYYNGTLCLLFRIFSTIVFRFWGKKIETEINLHWPLYCLTIKVCPEMMQAFNIDEKLAYRAQLCFHSFKVHSLLLNILARRQIVFTQQFENPLSWYRPAVSSRFYSFLSRPEASCVRIVNLSWKPRKFPAVMFSHKNQYKN